MKCPFCNYQRTQVIDSRASKTGDAVRRRRKCYGCKNRFTSYERIEPVKPVDSQKAAAYKNAYGVVRQGEPQPQVSEDARALLAAILAVGGRIPKFILDDLKAAS